MPLNIEVTEPTEHPDVTALKQKVAEAAKEHSRRNHCGEYKSWLRQLGIEDVKAKKIVVEITFTAFGVEGQKATKAFPEKDLVGKTAEEQNAWVAEQISEKVTIAGTQVAIPLTVTDLNPAEDAVVLTEASPSWGTTGLGLVVPYGYTHVYTSNEGRVAHLVRLNDETLRQLHLTNGEREQENIILTFLNRGNGYRGRATAACSTDPGAWGGWARASSRSENRICQNCNQQAERRPVARPA